MCILGERQNATAARASSEGAGAQEKEGARDGEVALAGRVHPVRAVARGAHVGAAFNPFDGYP